MFLKLCQFNVTYVQYDTLSTSSKDVRECTCEIEMNMLRLEDAFCSVSTVNKWLAVDIMHTAKCEFLLK